MTWDSDDAELFEVVVQTPLRNFGSRMNQACRRKAHLYKELRRFMMPDKSRARDLNPMNQAVSSGG